MTGDEFEHASHNPHRWSEPMDPVHWNDEVEDEVFPYDETDEVSWEDIEDSEDLEEVPPIEEAA